MKSFFTKLGTLLLCGVAVAVVGCTDFSQDIQAGDEALKGEIERVEKSTASTIAELKASISALEAAQKKIEADYAKKSDLDAAKKALQDAIEAEVADLNAAISAINTTLDGKADKSAVEALQKTMADAIAEANKTIANLEAAQEALEAELAKKADKAETDKVAADVETLKNGYQETTTAITNLQSALEGTQLDLEATESALNKVAGDVESLKQAYMEIVAGFQQFQADLASKASQTDMELAKKDIEALKTASAQAVTAIANLNTAVAVLEARVDGIENQLGKAQEQIAQQTTQLTNLAYDLEQAKGDLEDEAAVREAADKALQESYALLNMELTNFEMAYNVKVGELEAQIDALKDEAKKNTEGITNLNGKFEAAIAELEAQLDNLTKKHNEEVAQIYNVIAQERTAVEGMIAFVEESFAKADEELFTLVQDSLITVVYNTIYNYDTKYEAMFATVDEQIAAMDDEFRRALSALAQQDTNLDNMISAVGADLEAKHAEAMMAVVTNRTEIENMIAYMDEELKGLISGLTERVEKLEVDVEGLKKSLSALEKALQEAAQKCSDRDAAMAQTIQGLKDLCADYLNMIGANKDELYKHSQEIAKLWAEINDIAEYTGALNTTIQQLNNDMLTNFGLVDSALTELETAYKAADAEIKKQIEDGLAEVIAAAAKGDADLNARIDALFNLIVSDLNGRIQSVVFVPGHSDLMATMDIYDYGYDEVQIVVKATYQVTPAAHVVKVGKELDVQGVLQATSVTRAAADKYVWAEAAYVTDINESTGKFDVEYVFNYDELVDLIENKDQKMQYPYEREPRLVLGTFVQHPEYVMPAEDVDDEMGVAAETYFKNYKVSDFAAVAENYVDYVYVLVDEKDKEYSEKTDIVPWSANDDVRIKTPYAGYTLKIETEEGDIVTLDEFAQTMHLADAAPITPVFRHEQIYYVADAKTAAFKKDPKTAAYKDEKATCKDVHAFADPEDKGINREFTIAVENPTNEDAPKLIGHKLHNDLVFFFWSDSKTDKYDVNYACYNYIIDYRTFEFTLTGNEKLTGTIADQHVLDWTYPVALALAVEGETGPVANQKNINEEFNIKFSEYDLIPSEENEGLTDRYVDYKDIIEKYAASEVRNVEYTVDGKRSATIPQGAKKPDLTVLPKTGIIHDIAAIDILGGTYEFIGKDVTYHFTNVFTDDVETYTKVKYNYDLTLGDKPMHVDVVAEEEVIKYKSTPWTDEIDFAALTRAELAPAYKFPETYNSADDATNTGVAKLFARTSPAADLGEAEWRTQLAPGSGQVGLSEKDQQTIFNYEGANQRGYLTRIFMTWYGTEFHFELPFKIEAPAYKLDINPLHVAVVGDENVATANYLYVPEQGDDRTFTVVNSFMQDYFRVLNPDQENKLQVTFTILSADVDEAGLVHSTPRFTNGAVEITRGVNEEGSFLRTSSELEWGDYHYTYVHVKAQLLVNGVAFGEPVIVRINTEDPLNLSGNDNLEVKWEDNKDIVVDDIMAGAMVSIIDQKDAFDAARFAANTSKYYYRRASAYGAVFTVELEKVYFNDPAKGGEPTDVPSGYYTLEGNTLTIKKETANLETAVYAKVKVTMDYTLDCDEPEVVYVTYVFNR